MTHKVDSLLSDIHTFPLLFAWLANSHVYLYPLGYNASSAIFTPGDG